MNKRRNSVSGLAVFYHEKLIISILIQIEFRVKKHAKVFNTMCTQNTWVTKDKVNNQHISFFGTSNFYFTRIKLHIFKPVLHRVNVWLQEKTVINRINTTKYLYIISNDKNTGILNLATRIPNRALLARRSRVLFPMSSLDFSVDIILPAALWPWDRLRLLTEISTRNLPGGKARPAPKADNLTAICEPIV
jgi:hypothetical protein